MKAIVDSTRRVTRPLERIAVSAYSTQKVQNLPNKQQVLSVYKQLLKQCQKFNGYNFQQYGLRRTKDAFRSNKDLKDKQEIINCYNKALEDLEVVKRQTLISSLFGADKLVIEK
ncbi:hypothetical protein K502DRAFT_294537 [Neoconidiobolus thromboides FSU 785]|nr:hypothetical protein K502DRAFT_294537 [Neoconidiobolus thromboides FSU 785]